MATPRKGAGRRGSRHQKSGGDLESRRDRKEPQGDRAAGDPTEESPDIGPTNRALVERSTGAATPGGAGIRPLVLAQIVGLFFAVLSALVLAGVKYTEHSVQRAVSDEVARHQRRLSAGVDEIVESIRAESAREVRQAIGGAVKQANLAHAKMTVWHLAAGNSSKLCGDLSESEVDAVLECLASDESNAILDSLVVLRRFFQGIECETGKNQARHLRVNDALLTKAAIVDGLCDSRPWDPKYRELQMALRASLIRSPTDEVMDYLTPLLRLDGAEGFWSRAFAMIHVPDDLRERLIQDPVVASALLADVGDARYARSDRSLLFELVTESRPDLAARVYRAIASSDRPQHLVFALHLAVRARTDDILGDVELRVLSRAWFERIVAAESACTISFGQDAAIDLWTRDVSDRLPRWWLYSYEYPCSLWTDVDSDFPPGNGLWILHPAWSEGLYVPLDDVSDVIIEQLFAAIGERMGREVGPSRVSAYELLVGPLQEAAEYLSYRHALMIDVRSVDGEGWAEVSLEQLIPSFGSADDGSDLLTFDYFPDDEDVRKEVSWDSVDWRSLRRREPE